MAQCQGPRTYIRLFFWSSPVFGRKILRKSQTGAQLNVNPARAITCFAGVTISVVHFSITIHFHLASFYAT